MPTFKKNPNPIMKKGPYKMKYKHSAFPFKSSPAKFNPFAGGTFEGGVFNPGTGGGGGPTVNPHTHDDRYKPMDDKGGAAANMASVALAQGGALAGPQSGVLGMIKGVGRRTSEGQV